APGSTRTYERRRPASARRQGRERPRLGAAPVNRSASSRRARRRSGRRSLVSCSWLRRQGAERRRRSTTSSVRKVEILPQHPPDVAARQLHFRHRLVLSVVVFFGHLLL